MEYFRTRVALCAALVAFNVAPALAESGAGAYLAARQAAIANDFEASAEYFTRALVRKIDDPQLMESATLAHLSLGRIDRALPMAKRIEDAGLRSQIAHMVVTADLIGNEDYAALLERDSETTGIGPLVDGLIQAWAQIGNGSVAQGLERFDLVGQEIGLHGFALYHKALALAMVGDFEGADGILGGEDAGSITRTRRGAMAHAEILSQLNRNEDALGMLRDTFGARLDPELEEFADRLNAGETLPFTHVTSVNDGLAEVFYSVGAALRSEASPDYTLLYTRVAEHARPNHVDAILLNAELLEELGQYDLAIEVYKRVPKDHQAHHAAELGRAAALRKSDKPDASIEVLEQLTRTYPDLPIIHSTLGNVLRQREDYAESIPSYDRALELTGETAPSRWFLLYARGISHERLEMWPEAESDFRAALALSPEQPQVLNYLGYSMVEKQVHLDEALEMIERAVAARPDSGFIVDSLGWVLYRLGQYEDAVGHMERAVELEAVDPIVNDHLGDVYWAVGRKREAQFQWQRALSFEPEEVEAERIRRKIEVGLDAVLEEEGAPSLQLVQEDNDG